MDQLFGDREDFAIQAGVEPDLKPPSAPWGHMCLWCRGVAIGDITELHCGLAHSYSSIRWLASHLEELWAPELEGLGDVDAWNFLDERLYGFHGEVEIDDDRTDEQVHADWVAWNRFDPLTNRGEHFDGYKTFFLCPPDGTVRVLSRKLPKPMGRGVTVSRAGLKAAVEGFARWYEEESRRLDVPR